MGIEPDSSGSGMWMTGFAHSKCTTSGYSFVKFHSYKNHPSCAFWDRVFIGHVLFGRKRGSNVVSDSLTCIFMDICKDFTDGNERYLTKKENIGTFYLHVFWFEWIDWPKLVSK